MKKVSLLMLSFLGAIALQAQDYTDALRYGESFVEGNGRYMAMGGATTALGGNVGSLSVNPAGSAVFKKSVFELSPSYQYTKSENHYTGYDKAFASKIRIPSLGLVAYKPMKQNSVFVSGLSFAFAMNAQNRYDETIKYTTKNATNSLTDDFVRLASNNKWYDNYNTLAWNSYLLDSLSDGTIYSDYIKDGVYGQYQDATIDRTGVKREYLFNFGVDFSEWVFIGADLVFENIAYSETKKITEKDKNDNLEYLNSFTYTENLEATGNGVGGKFGILARPIEYIRIGAAVHTPIKYNISEDYESRIVANYDKPINADGKTQVSSKYTSSNSYKVAQPAKFVGSLGFVYKNIANVGVDIETMNFSNSMFEADFDISDANETIDTTLGKVTNLKCGGEFRYGPFTFRAGYAMYGNPYKNVSGDNFYRNDYSAGVGLATNTMYCDLSWLRAKTKQNNTLYKNLAGDDLTANSTLKRDYITITFGVKF